MTEKVIDELHFINDISMNTLIQHLDKEEDNLIGCPLEDIKMILGPPDVEDYDEWVYVLKTYCYGLLKLKLYLFFEKEEVTDYYLGF